MATVIYVTNVSLDGYRSSPRTSRFDAEAVRDMKTAAARDMTVGGASLTAHAFDAGLVDECQLFVHPVLVGRGKPAFPSDARVKLELLEEHRFDSGIVYLRYRTRSS